MKVTGAKAKEILEPGVVVPGIDEQSIHSMDPEQMMASMCISLKRIADVIENFDPSRELPQLHGHLTNLAWEMGRNFRAGSDVGL